MPQNLTNEQVNIGLGNGLMLSSSKPLPEPMLIPIYALANSLRHNEFKHCLSFFVMVVMVVCDNNLVTEQATHSQKEITRL